jgi:integrase
MPRPPLPIGTYGEITQSISRSGSHVARASYRDFDGVTRPVARTGRTPAIARNKLLTALRERSTPNSRSGLTAESRFSAAAELWLTSVQEAADVGDMSPNTAQLYALQLKNHVRPVLGGLRLREVTTPRVDDFLRVVRTTKGVATAKTCRTVVAGVMGLALRYGAVVVNPVREAARVRGGRRRTPRALTGAEREQWLAALEADRRAVARDLPDLTRWMLATGLRIGEALAVAWSDVDLDAGTVEVDWKLIRIKGEGLRRVQRLKGGDDRTLPLPPFAVAMLRRRRPHPGSLGPVFPDELGGWRDPSNTSRAFREARDAAGFSWVTSHVFRKTCATILDEAGMSARAIADQLGHARPSMTQDVYMARKVLNPATAAALEAAAAPAKEAAADA